MLSKVICHYDGNSFNMLFSLDGIPELVEKNIILEQVQGEKSRLNQENEAMAKGLNN